MCKVFAARPTNWGAVELNIMPTLIATIIMAGLGLYLAVGLLFAVAFSLWGAGRLDQRARHGSWGFRLLVIPGAMALWPWLAVRWRRGTGEPAAEHNAHRDAALGKGDRGV